MSRTLAWLLVCTAAAAVALWGLCVVSFLGAAVLANARVAATPLARATDMPVPGPTSLPTLGATAEPGLERSHGGPLIDPTPGPTPTLVPSVDWPDLPDLGGWEPAFTTDHFAVYAADAEDTLLMGLVEEWGPQLEAILTVVGRRLDRELTGPPVGVVFARTYPSRCPARGLTSTGDEHRLLMLYAEEDTPETQIRGVLAHEIAHHLTVDADWIGDEVLTEGIANWAAGDAMLAWQGYSSWDDAVLDYLARSRYVSVADPTALNPRSGEACLSRRDRVYNTRTAFVDWLIQKIGLDTVLAMPYVELPVVDPDTGEVAVDPETGEPQTVREPDYETASGYDLPTLEMLWLMELWANR